MELAKSGAQEQEDPQQLPFLNRQIIAAFLIQERTVVYCNLKLVLSLGYPALIHWTFLVEVW